MAFDDKNHDRETIEKVACLLGCQFMRRDTSVDDILSTALSVNDSITIHTDSGIVSGYYKYTTTDHSAILVMTPKGFLAIPWENINKIQVN